MNSPVLAFADPSKPYVDASLYELGTILYQEEGLRVVALASRKLNHSKKE